MNDVVSEIKSRLSIENLVAEYISLKRIGKSLKGLCPFHSEKTPSFIVSPDKGIAYCFGCHKGGDIFNFLMEVENIEFGEAIRLLAEKTGVEIQNTSRKEFVKKGEKEVLMDIHEEVAKFYEKELWSERGKEVLSYLQDKRGLNEDIIKQFRLGFAPDSYEETHQYLLKKGFKKSQILQAGLAMAKDTSLNNIYDRFRNRIIFPVSDSLGRIVGFGGRALQDDQQPKYLNSPETLIYHKNQLLYGFSQSKSHIKIFKQAIIVEGYLDFLMAFQDGIKNVIAVNGTALTNRHLLLLKPYIEELVLSFDMDNAGKEAGRRSYELTQEFNFIVKILTLPKGKDIADFVKDNKGKLKDLVGKIQLYADFYYADLFKRFDKESFKGKREILREFIIFINKIKSSIEKDSYIRKLAADLGVSETKIYDEIKINKLSDQHPAKQLEDISNKIEQYNAEDILIGLILNYPKYVYEIKDKISQADFSENLKTIYIRFLSIYNHSGINQNAILAILSDLDDKLKSHAKLMSLYVEERYKDLPEDLIVKEIIELIAKLKTQNINTHKRDLYRKLKEAESGNDKAQIETILIELNNLSHK